VEFESGNGAVDSPPPDVGAVPDGPEVRLKDSLGADVLEGNVLDGAGPVPIVLGAVPELAMGTVEFPSGKGVESDDVLACVDVFTGGPMPVIDVMASLVVGLATIVPLTAGLVTEIVVGLVVNVVYVVVEVDTLPLGSVMVSITVPVMAATVEVTMVMVMMVSGLSGAAEVDPELAAELVPVPLDV